MPMWILTTTQLQVKLHQIYLSVPERDSITVLTKQFLLMLNDADAWDMEQKHRSDAANLDELYAG